MADYKRFLLNSVDIRRVISGVPAGIENVFISMFYKGNLSGCFVDTIMDTIKR
ncbi:TPA: hypothetical protein LOQ35_002219 [Escherichia coli]|nr:hypothetical protein [Escherichia coli]HBL0979250.1 hypothetical protein [Escherichia coli]HDH7527274.1 hypothetical protein [Escherichia coli]HEI4751970.1 hypothetical protein [Escherichia coli]